MIVDFSLSSLVDKYIKAIFTERIVPEEMRKKLWKKYYDKLCKGLEEGYQVKSFEIDDKALVQSFKLNMAEFSAFKETSFKKNLEALLISPDGKLRSWNEFKTEAFKISGEYNIRWLETEYHQTIASAQIAGKWNDFKRNLKLYPNVKFLTVADGRVRHEHQLLHGMIRPYDDPFWKTHLPPLDWGCRCDIVQTDEEPTEVPEGFQTKIEFENNPAISGKIFNGSAYEKTLTDKEKEEAKSIIKIKLSDEEKAYRKEIQKYAIKMFKGQIVHNKKDIKITTKGIKEFLNQPHEHYFKKNELAKNLPEIIKKSEYIGELPYHKEKLNVIKSHLYEIKINHDKSWLIMREDSIGNINFYSITDQVNILDKIKKSK